MSAEPKGRGAWFAALGPHARDLHRFLLSRLRVPHDVDDVSQEIYLRLLQHDHPESVGEPLAYLYGVAKHVLADFSKDALRRRRHVITDSDEVARIAEDLPDSAAGNFPERVALQEQLDRALRRLPRTEARVLILHEHHGLTYAEVALELGLSMHTVEKYLVRARARLRTLLWDAEPTALVKHE